MDKVPLLDCGIPHHTTKDLKEVSLTMQWIAGIQTARLGCGHQSGPWTGSSSSWPWSRSPEEYYFNNHTWMRLYGSPGFQERTCSTASTGAIKCQFGCTRETKNKTAWVYPHHSFPEVHISVPWEVFSVHDFSHGTKWVGTRLPHLYGMLPNSLSRTLVPSRTLSHGWKEAVRAADRILEEH